MSLGKAFGEGGASRPTKRQLHPQGIAVFNRLRKVDEDKVKALASSMKETGLINPIVVRPNNINKTGYSLIAGAHRLAAAKKLGWEAIDAIIVDVSDNHARIAEIDENLIRNELTAAERAIHISERKRLYEEQHPETKHGGDRKSAKIKSQSLRLDAGRFTADTARKTGVSESKVQKDASRGEKIAGIADVIGTSLDKGEELDALARLPISQQAILIRRAADGERVSAKTEAKKFRRAEKEQALAEKTITASLAASVSQFNVVYADPPWKFETFSENGMDRSADNHYPTMTLDDIKALQIPAADDAVLFLWATVPMLPEALDVMSAWGFKYKSHCIWAKDKSGTGYWFRNRHELLLVGIKGNIPAPAPGTQLPSVIEEVLLQHSKKPAVFAEMIEKLFPSLPKIELFCRSPRDGWEAHGNEAD